jgi:hypothetical protein
MDWRKKLTSRKMWAAIAEFVGMLIVAFGVAQETAVQITAIIMAGATVIAYIVGEGLVDAASAKGGGMGYVDYEPPEEEDF